VVEQVVKKPDGKNFIQHIALITTIILLPGFYWVIFGWLYIFLPLIVFLYLHWFGRNIGGKFLVSAIVVSLFASVFMQTIPQVLFALTLIPGGLILADCAEKGETVCISGLKTTITILSFWIAYLLIISIGSEPSIYSTFIQSLDSSVTEAIKLYRQNGALTPEIQLVFEQTLRDIQIFLPKILVALCTIMAILMTWIAMTMGNYLLLQRRGDSPWPKYKLWQLPDRLIWIFITSAIFFIIPDDTASITGINLLIIIGLLYCIQGFSIVVYFFSKWNLPRIVRIIFYFMILFQSIGTVILLGFGLINTWIDLRKIKLPNQINNQHNDNTNE